MSLTHMKVFNEFIMPATIETLDQMVQAFNEASAVWRAPHEPDTSTR